MVDVTRFGDSVLQVVRGLSPYDTGNLMNNGITNLESDISQANFRLNERGGAPYGPILNEAAIICYKGTTRRVNVHYRWLDNAVAYGVILAAREIGAVVEF